MLFVFWLSSLSVSYFAGYEHGKKEQQKTIKTEVHKRCLDSDIYNEFQCYNMIIKGE
ncbi:MAG: hypothetical protein GY928_07065 [Colwellia sp.]|nr:hypothetical protein [Colwellia sp.]